MSGTSQPRLRFSLKGLLLAVLFVALALCCGRIAYRWWTAMPTVPLAVMVQQFNAYAVENNIGVSEPLLTESEVLTAIQTQLPMLNATQNTKAIYERIAKTQQLPANARLYFLSAWQLPDSSVRDVWWINLDVVAGKDAGFTIRIRENNNPATPRKSPSNVETSELNDIGSKLD